MVLLDVQFVFPNVSNTSKLPLLRKDLFVHRRARARSEHWPYRVYPPPLRKRSTAPSRQRRDEPRPEVARWVHTCTSDTAELADKSANGEPNERGCRTLWHGGVVGVRQREDHEGESCSQHM